MLAPAVTMLATASDRNALIVLVFLICFVILISSLCLLLTSAFFAPCFGAMIPPQLHDNASWVSFRLSPLRRYASNSKCHGIISKICNFYETDEQNE